MPAIQDRHEALVEAALEQVSEPYLNALSDKLEGKDGREHWAEFRRIMVRTLVLSGLLGIEHIVNQLRQAGFSIEAEGEPLEQHEELEQFQERKASDLITAPFLEAINEFAGKIPMLRQQVDQLAESAKRRAFWVTDVEDSTAIERIQEKLKEPLQGVPEGGTLREFLDFAENEEAVDLSLARLETVYRTNTLSALNEGAHRQMAEEGVKSQTALWMLDEVQDNRTRGNPNGLYPDQGMHWQMDGFIASPDDPVWNSIWPPNGYNCRASVAPITWPEAERKGWANNGQLDEAAIDQHNGNRRDLIASGEYPDEGFSNGPKGGLA